MTQDGPGPEHREGATRAVVSVAGTDRLATFSDGVLAIVMTLLVLDLRVPAEGQAEGGLLGELRVLNPVGLLDVRVFLAGLLALAGLYLLPNSDPNTA